MQEMRMLERGSAPEFEVAPTPVVIFALYTPEVTKIFGRPTQVMIPDNFAAVQKSLYCLYLSVYVIYKAFAFAEILALPGPCNLCGRVDSEGYG